MMGIEASKHLWNARVDPRRRTVALGVYNPVIDQWGLIYDQPILLGERQAVATIEGRFDRQRHESNALPSTRTDTRTARWQSHGC